MKPTDISRTLTLLHGIRRPAFLWGPPGVGKSDIIKQFAQQAGLRLIDFRMVYCEPVDMRGIPGIQNGRTVYHAPAELPDLTSGPSLLFFDEFNNAAPATQAVGYQIMLDHRIGDFQLSPDCYIIAAGNRESDRGVTYRMPSPLANRLVHLDYEVDLGDWCGWAVKAGIRVEVIAFLRFRPELLRAEGGPQGTDKAFPTPRSWQFVSEILDASCHAPLGIEHEIYRGTVGEGASAEFAGFLRVFRDMPSIDGILMAPATAEVPEGKPAVLYAITSALARRVTESNFDRVTTYLARLPAEYAASCIHDVMAREPKLQSHPAFTTWAATHGTII